APVSSAAVGQTAVGPGRGQARQPGGSCAGDGLPLRPRGVARNDGRRRRVDRRLGRVADGGRDLCFSQGVECVSSLSEFSPKYLRLEMADDIVIVSVEVELLTEDVNLEHFGHELFALVEQFGCRRVVVNLKEVRMVTSAGLGKMITMHRKM